MPRPAILLCLISLFSPLHAGTSDNGRSGSDRVEVRSGGIVAAGSVGLDPATSIRRVSSVVVAGTGSDLSNGGPGAGKIDARSGLWSGGSPLRSASSSVDIKFGDSARPAALHIPGGSLGRDFALFTGTAPLASPLRASPSTVQQALTNLALAGDEYTRPVGGRLYEIFVQDEVGARPASLAPPASLTLPYDDADGDGVLDGEVPPIRAETLSIWWLDEAHSLWVKLPDSIVDPASRTVSAPIRHFSVFTVMGGVSFDPGDVYAFPVPWRPYGPGAGLGAGGTGTAEDGITFTNLPSRAVIRIYTLSGGQARAIQHESGLPQLVWNGLTDAGDDAATGTYIWVVESGGGRKTGKLVIIR